MNHDELVDWIRLIRTESVGPATFKQLIARFGTANEALHHLPALTAKRRTPIKICSASQAEAEMDTATRAGGTDTVYPPEHAALYEESVAQGLLVSEAPPGAEPLAASFPRQNRIISALSRGVVVIEATPKSGSLITARFAAEQGRDVFAVPGSPLDPRAKGPNGLIHDGAVLVEKIDDILSAFSLYTRISENLSQIPQKTHNLLKIIY